ncbi:DNA-binding HxlR family transcriptional regulator [Hamadaea flava]|uniref:Winged helix-turn-helix transcriptional regulator n=1 Tax=Hamadaea flava TaxID=1742688 RepID=A0ABV8M2A6_9ACTN|nr:helix-turn-helix domain-containing protein [Hamadaea flava]MCP2328386.1 DNA-binding HxlR family transcriptional regulator [Hamadaea flava]
MIHSKPDLFDELCPSAFLPVRMDHKWGPLVLGTLEAGPLRFSELRTVLHRTSPKELTRALRTLERDGFVVRSAAGRAVSYELTPLGRSLLGPLKALYAWTAEHWDEILDARDPVEV